MKLEKKHRKPNEHRLVKNEIINNVLSHLKTVFTLHKLPSSKEMREIAYTLSYTYPAMFQCTGEFEEEIHDGCLAPENVDDLASKMKERLRGQLRYELKTNPHGGDEDDVEEPPKEKGRTKIIYGVDQNKWHRAKKAKPEAAAAIVGTNAEMEFEKREAVYEANRPALTAEFKSKKPIKSSCKGFWLSDRHLANHFMYVTNSQPLNAKVDERINTQFGLLEAFLMDQCKTVDFRDQMEAVKNACEVDHSGSTTLKNVHLMRFASQHFDGGSGSELVRLESDGPPKDGSPHLLVIEVNRSQLQFEVWVEGQKLLGNLHLAAAISAFLHLCFCFDLHYPKGAETMSDLLQIGLAKYGDNTGTRTWKKASSAEKKRDFYYGVIGRLAAQ